MEGKNSLTRRCGYSLFQISIGRDPELPGDLLEDLPNVISSSSILHDDVAAHTARIRSNARLAVMQFNDNLATRRALDQRPKPLKEFSVGDEVAVWRRGTGKGAPGKQRRAQWRGPEALRMGIESLTVLFPTEVSSFDVQVEWQQIGQYSTNLMRRLCVSSVFTWM